MKRNKSEKKRNVNYYEKFENWWKNNRLVTILVIIFICLGSLYTVIQVFGIFTNLFIAITKEHPNFIINQDSVNSKGFLIFRSKTDFDNWQQEVTFRLGLPKYARNLATTEIDENYFIQQYANWRKHPKSFDTRGFCGYNNRVPGDLINKEAEKKYNFIKASYADLEDMGFIKDEPPIVDEEVYDYEMPMIPDSPEIKPLKILRSWRIEPEYNIELVMILHKVKQNRNKYIFDLGSIANKSRISIFFDKSNFLCYRIIDENSVAHILRSSYELFGLKTRLNFIFGKSAERSYMDIYANGTPIALVDFNYRVPFFYYDNNMIFFGANLDRTYCAKLRMFWANIFVTMYDANHSLCKFDYLNTESMFMSDDGILAYKEKEGPIMNFHRR